VSRETVLAAVTGSAVDVPGNADDIAGGDCLDSVADLDHLADGLVSDRERPAKRRLAGKDMMIEIAGGCGDRPDNGLPRTLNARLGTFAPFQTLSGEDERSDGLASTWMGRSSMLSRKGMMKRATHAEPVHQSLSSQLRE
jgi:hypothetical protein